jgi:hypothetical protein
MLHGSSMNSGEPLDSLSECPDKPINGKEGQDIIQRQSDYSKVSRRPMKVGGETGIAVMREDGGDTPVRPRTGAEVATKLASLTRQARGDPKRKFTSLAYLLTEGFLTDCFRELKRDKDSGVDGVSVAEYERNLEGNLKDLVRRLEAKQYWPQPVRRAYIPKDGGQRGLGIPTVEDKIVQLGVKKILEAIFEVDFIEGVSYGFRPRKSLFLSTENRAAR